jgi:hypothetical protein
MKALIVPQDNGLVTQVHETGFEVAEPLYWIDCPTEVTAGWVYVDGVFTPPDTSEIYKMQREFNYPSMADYLDGIVKGDQVQIQAYIDACLAVKAQFPKPTE